MKNVLPYEDAEEIHSELLENYIDFGDDEVVIDCLIKNFSHNVDAWLKNLFKSEGWALTTEEKQIFKKVTGEILFKRDLENILFSQASN